MNNGLPQNSSTDETTDDLQPEYVIDYRKAKANRFAAAMPAGSRVVVLDPDVAAIFRNDETVNTLLRALIQAMPSTLPSPEGSEDSASV